MEPFVFPDLNELNIILWDLFCCNGLIFSQNDVKKL